MMHFRYRRTLALSAVAASALALAGCSSTESEPAAATTTITSSAAAAGQPTGKAKAADSDATLTAAPTGTAPQNEAASEGAALTITDIRVGRHDGFDRVVYQFDGTGTPGWRAEIVGTATQQGSGNPLAISGQGVLQVLIAGTAMPFETGIEPYSGPNPLEVENPVVVTEVRDAGIYEGTAQTLIGLSDRDVSYRVYTLSEPTRLVVDIAP